jgi:hypothetical protein
MMMMMAAWAGERGKGNERGDRCHGIHACWEGVIYLRYLGKTAGQTERE